MRRGFTTLLVSLTPEGRGRSGGLSARRGGWRRVAVRNNRNSPLSGIGARTLLSGQREDGETFVSAKGEFGLATMLNVRYDTEAGTPR